MTIRRCAFSSLSTTPRGATAAALVALDLATSWHARLRS